MDSEKATCSATNPTAHVQKNRPPHPSSSNDRNQLDEVDGRQPIAHGQPCCQRQDEAKQCIGNEIQTDDGKKYQVGEKLANGSFGIVYRGERVSGSPVLVAIKFVKKDGGAYLRDEYRAYKTLSGCIGIPDVYHYGKLYLHHILVMDLLGPSLEVVFKNCGQVFKPKTVAMLGKRMLRIVRSIHDKDLINGDIKPENFLLGRPGTPAANDIYIVDFGMANGYQDPKTKKHIPYMEQKPPSGTLRYMSINTHLGREKSRRDDLECLFYVLLYLLKRRLPWQGMRTTEDQATAIRLKKQNTTIGDLCAGCPIQFVECLTHVRNLDFEARPDYEHLGNLLTEVLTHAGAVDDGRFDWMERGEGEA